MWTKQSEILNFSKDYLDGICVEEVLKSLKGLKISISTEEIQKRIEAQAEKTQNNGVYEEKKYIVDEDALAFNKKTLSIYVKKGISLCNILLGLAQNFSLVGNVVEGLDLHVEQNSIETKDLIRVLKPLKNNYLLANEISLVGNDVERYITTEDYVNVKKKKRSLPTSGVLSLDVSRHKPDSVEMTENQKKKRFQMKRELSKKISEEMLNEKDC